MTTPWRRLLASLTILTICWLAPTPSPSADPERRRVRIETGERAKFSGVLVSDPYLAALVAELDRLRGEVEVEQRARAREVAHLRVALGAECNARVEAEAARVAACDAQLARDARTYREALERPPWLPYATAAGGAILGAGLCAAGAWSSR